MISEVSFHEINFNDVGFNHLKDLVDFQVSEGHFLEYKSKIETTIAKSVSCMANTDGGRIVCGIKIDQTTKRPIGFESLDRNAIEDDFDRICGANIKPRVDLQRRIVESNDKSHSLLLIEIFPSKYGPHFYGNNPNWYIRNSAECLPSDFSSLDMLLNNRRNQEEFRTRLNEQAKARSSELFSPVNNSYEVSIFASPFYPNRELIEYYKLFEAIREVIPNDESTYIINKREMAPNFNNGSCYAIPINSNLSKYCDFTTFGSFYCCISESFQEYDESTRKLHLQSLVLRLCESSLIAQNFLRKLNYCGGVWISFQIQKIKKSVIYEPNRSLHLRGWCQIEEKVPFSSSLYASEFFNRDFEFMDGFLGRLLHAYGMNDTAIEWATTIRKEAVAKLVEQGLIECSYE